MAVQLKQSVEARKESEVFGIRTHYFSNVLYNTVK